MNSVTAIHLSLVTCNFGILGIFGLICVIREVGGWGNSEKRLASNASFYKITLFDIGAWLYTQYQGFYAAERQR